MTYENDNRLIEAIKNASGSIIKVSRLRDKHQKMLAPLELAAIYKRTSNERNVLKTIDECNRKCREWVKYVTFEQNPKHNQLSDYSHYGNEMFKVEGKRLLILKHLVNELSKQLESCESNFFGENMAEDGDMSSQLPVHRYDLLMMYCEKYIQEFINFHQRNNYDFEDNTTPLDAGLDEAVGVIETHIANVISEFRLGSQGDSCAAITLKCIWLNRARNLISSRIASSEEHKKLTWLKYEVFRKLMFCFESGGTAIKALESVYKNIPDKFEMQISKFIRIHCEQRYPGRKNIFDKMEKCERSKVILGYLLIENINFSITSIGETNLDRRAVNNKGELNTSHESMQFISDRFSAIDGLSLNLIASMVNANSISENDERIEFEVRLSLAKYFDVRIKKQKTLLFLNDKLRETDSSMISSILEGLDSLVSQISHDI